MGGDAKVEDKVDSVGRAAKGEKVESYDAKKVAQFEAAKVSQCADAKVENPWQMPLRDCSFDAFGALETYHLRIRCGWYSCS